MPGNPRIAMIVSRHRRGCAVFRPRGGARRCGLRAVSTTTAPYCVCCPQNAAPPLTLAAAAVAQVRRHRCCTTCRRHSNVARESGRGDPATAHPSPACGCGRGSRDEYCGSRCVQCDGAPGVPTGPRDRNSNGSWRNFPRCSRPLSGPGKPHSGNWDCDRVVGIVGDKSLGCGAPVRHRTL